jgi:hypothetical protein
MTLTLRAFPVSLYNHAERFAGLIVAACGTVLMAVAAFPSLAAVSPNLVDASVAYAEMAGLCAMIGTAALVHARQRTTQTRGALFAATSLWWAATLAFFPSALVFDLIGLVAILASVASLGTSREDDPTELIGATILASLYGRARPYGA